MSKFKVGDRVKVIGVDSLCYEDDVRIGEYGNVIGVEPKQDDFYNINVKGDRGNEEPFMEEQLELITPIEGIIPDRRTFRLLKNTSELKKGAIIQEMCDDGNQDYCVLTHSDIKYTNEAGDLCYIAPRGSVENEPKWWTEVFQVAPNYLTKEEVVEYTKAIKKAKK